MARTKINKLASCLLLAAEVLLVLLLISIALLKETNNNESYKFIVITKSAPQSFDTKAGCLMIGKMIKTKIYPGVTFSL